MDRIGFKCLFYGKEALGDAGAMDAALAIAYGLVRPPFVLVICARIFCGELSDLIVTQVSAYAFFPHVYKCFNIVHKSNTAIKGQ